MIWENIPEKRNVHSRTIVKFLENRGWEQTEPSGRYYVLIPPVENRKDNPDFDFWIVREELEGTRSYWLDVSGVIGSIAEIYEIDVHDLYHLFSKTPEEIQKDAALRAFFEGSKVPTFQIVATQS